MEYIYELPLHEVHYNLDCNWNDMVGIDLLLIL